MNESVKVSVVIPTHNRVEPLHRLLNSLAKQTLAPDKFEVIVVDDGSDYDPVEVTGREYPFLLRFLRQKNQGATVARNQGARLSQGDILVFIDDDVTVSETALQALAETCLSCDKVAVIGTLFLRSADRNSGVSRAIIAEEEDKNFRRGKSNGYLPYTWCNTQLLGVRRSDFFELGMLQDPTGGWPNWDDVDFGYRAHLAGISLRECPEAAGEHWDHSITSVEKSSRRWFQASKSAVRLFQRYPEMQSNIPMYFDKAPVLWSQDEPRLIARKILRRLSSSGPSLFILERAAALTVSVYPSVRILQRLYRWIKGGYMFRGYRAGIKEYGQVPPARIEG
jgi:glycosyltransferase involved in cell wall biosynthesis